MNFRSNFNLLSLADFQLSMDVHKYTFSPGLCEILALELYCTFWQCAEQIQSGPWCALLCVSPEERTVYNRMASCGSKVWHDCYCLHF